MSFDIVHVILVDNILNLFTYNVNAFANVSGNQFLILICIVGVVFIVLLVSITVGICKLIDKRKARKSAKRQLLIDSTTSHRYSGGPQRQMMPMYNERIEMVPDILENSLPRTHLASYAPGSESSYGTNYPGTMYFMGPPGQVALSEKSNHLDSVPLPKKPDSVSDSESEDLYATPAY